MNADTEFPLPIRLPPTGYNLLTGETQQMAAGKGVPLIHAGIQHRPLPFPGGGILFV